MNIHPAQEVDRYIRFFEKEGKQSLAGEISLDGIPLAKLIELIPEEEFEEDFLLFNCYYLDKNKLEYLAKLLNKEIPYDLDNYDYYLEANSK